MSSEFFKIEEHIVPCQHVREYRRATISQEDVLKLHVKQYTPLNNLHPKPGDVTILAAHGNGFLKELYEPLWDELLALSPSNGFRIRSIWIADVAWQGQSSVLNEGIIANDPNWHDHARDLLLLVNLKRDKMPQPIVGIGHSMGGAQMTQLSLLHPRLLHTLVLLDPVIDYRLTRFTSRDRGGLATSSTYRRDLWPSREAAEASFRKSPFFSSWDPRVLNRFLKYGLREVPTAIYPPNTADDSSQAPSPPPTNPVTLTTTKHQEVFTFLRPNPAYNPTNDQPSSTLDRTHYPDLDPAIAHQFPLYRPEEGHIASNLPSVRPSVYYIHGGNSTILPNPGERDHRTNDTGTGVGGSGGVPAGRVSSIDLDECGHEFPFTHVRRAAEPTATWLGKELKRWRDEDEAFMREWEKKSNLEKATVDRKWLDLMGPDPREAAKKKKAIGGGGAGGNPSSSPKL